MGTGACSVWDTFVKYEHGGIYWLELFQKSQNIQEANQNNKYCPWKEKKNWEITTGLARDH